MSYPVWSHRREHTNATQVTVKAMGVTEESGWGRDVNGGLASSNYSGRLMAEWLYLLFPSFLLVSLNCPCPLSGTLRF